MECALCGQNFPKLNRAIVEGTVIEVCDNCLKFGTKIAEKEPIYKPIAKKISFKELETNQTFVYGYGEKIRKAREIKELARDEFAKRINEKESVIKRIEEEQMEPTEELTKRIENFLGINLREKYEEHRMRKEQKKGKLTVGDIVRID